MDGQRHRIPSSLSSRDTAPSPIKPKDNHVLSCAQDGATPKWAQGQYTLDKLGHLSTQQPCVGLHHKSGKGWDFVNVSDKRKLDVYLMDVYEYAFLWYISLTSFLKKANTDTVIYSQPLFMQHCYCAAQIKIKKRKNLSNLGAHFHRKVNHFYFTKSTSWKVQDFSILVAVFSMSLPFINQNSS